MISLIDFNGNVSIQSCCANQFQISKVGFGFLKSIILEFLRRNKLIVLIPQ